VTLYVIPIMKPASLTDTFKIFLKSESDSMFFVIRAQLRGIYAWVMLDSSKKLDPS